jgi:hypothetical protein
MLNLPRRVGDVHVIQAAYVMPPSEHNWPYVVSLDTSSCSLSFIVAHGSWWWLDYRPWLFYFFPFFSLFWQMYTIVLFVFYFSISVLILLIFYFVPFLFIKFFILFNFVIQLQFSHMLDFSFRSLFFKFLILSLTFLLKFFFF